MLVSTFSMLIIAASRIFVKGAVFLLHGLCLTAMINARKNDRLLASNKERSSFS